MNASENIALVVEAREVRGYMPSETRATADTKRPVARSSDVSGLRRAVAETSDSQTLDNESLDRSQGAGADTLTVQQAQELVDRVQQRLSDKGVDLKFRLREETGDLQVEILEKDSEKVVRKIPSDELIHLAESIDEMAGGLLDKAL